MIGLPRKVIRQGGFFFLFLIFATFLVLFANKQKVIILNDYLPVSFTPSFFQPAADSYFIDLSVNGCLKFNRNSPTCGVPRDGNGMGSWIRLEKDLTLGKSWTNTYYLSFKKVSEELLREDTNGENSGKSKRNARESTFVIIDIAISNPEVDVKIKGNEKSKIPFAIIKDLHTSKVFDDVAHELLVKEKAEAMKGGKLQAATVDKDKTASKKIEKVMQSESQKAEDKAKADAQAEAEINNVVEKAEKVLDNVDGTLQKRTIEKSRHDLEVEYKIPNKAQLKERGWTAKDHGIWVRYGASTDINAITGIDVLFGEDSVDPRPNWELIKSGSISGIGTDKDKEAYISIRRGPKKDYKKEYPGKLKINKNGKYKILQVADLHFSTGVGECRDPMPESTKKGCQADPRTLRFLEKVLDLEKPDLVVLTGDQIFGDAAPDSETAIFKALHPFIQRKIPFAVTLGNHDDEGSLTREEVMALSASLPYSMASLGPQDVAGVGNYVLTVDGPASTNPALTLYFLDTHKYSPNPKVNPGYDWLKESQLKWLEEEALSRKKSQAAYTHIHLSMTFFHIPLPEHKNTHGQPFIGELKEPPTAPKYNTGARTLLQRLGIKVASVGHDHANDYCLLDVSQKDTNLENKIWLCYGGGSGEGGYGGWGGYVRRLRTFEVDTNTGEISTWKRREDKPDEVFDQQIIVSGGEVVNF
ncbi:phosphatase Dcr2p [[Candida] railenensis]|uniref:Phosphatase Dcr2p n=1 Tax=[Candida] railenensis TaxID=45579 RepID=A0A9P0QLI0_9ASCO|nr:phosphatase Dcr2p [[Candida] railenensis]